MNGHSLETALYPLGYDVFPTFCKDFDFRNPEIVLESCICCEMIIEYLRGIINDDLKLIVGITQNIHTTLPKWNNKTITLYMSRMTKSRMDMMTIYYEPTIKKYIVTECHDKKGILKTIKKEFDIMEEICDVIYNYFCVH